MDFVLELAQLIKKTPRHHLPMHDCENCPYNSFLYKSKNCYLCYSSGFLKDCMYLDMSQKNSDCIDGDYLSNCELCYSCTDCDKCYNCDFCVDCVSCVDTYFSYQCQNCTNCFGCVGLNKKNYYIFNKPYSKEEYAEKIKELKALSTEEIMHRVESLRKTVPHIAMHITQSENSYGDYIKNSRNCFMAFNAENSSDSGYIYDEAIGLRDCYDCDHTSNSELSYGLMSADQCYDVNCSWWMVNCRSCEYGICNTGCTNCFGCVNVQRREYAILNKNYSKEEYFQKVAEIKDDLRKRGLYGKFLLDEAWKLAQTL